MDVLAPMTREEFAGYSVETVRNFAAEKAKAGQWPRGKALALAKATFEKLLPDGIDTPDHWLFNVLDDDGRRAGVLWMARQQHGAKDVAYVYDVMIHPDFRRQGHAERAFAALESKARELGLEGVVLHVFGHNTEGRALYAKLGFEPTSIHMFKPL